MLVGNFFRRLNTGSYLQKQPQKKPTQEPEKVTFVELFRFLPAKIRPDLKVEFVYAFNRNIGYFSK